MIDPIPGTAAMNGTLAAQRAATRMAAELRRTASVNLDPAAVLDRSDAIALAAPGLRSANGSCRLVRAKGDEWIAVNLPRTDDRDLVPAWIRAEVAGEDWGAIAAAAATADAAALVLRGAELGLAVARLGEAAGSGPSVQKRRGRNARPGPRIKQARVIDFSALWAGPLCGAILAQAGHEVVKVESHSRPDPVARSSPAHDRRLNGDKRRLTIDFTADALQRLMAGADAIVTSARPRAFAALGITPERLFAAHPHLTWIAITAHGWCDPNAMRVGFGDDAAVAGGLVDRINGEPAFAGDALADPLTGLAAGLAALHALDAGGGLFLDVALARTAANVAQGRCP